MILLDINSMILQILNYNSRQKMIANSQLEDKMKKSSSFDKQMQKADQNYRLLCQQAHYSNLSMIKQDLLSKFQNHKNPFDIHFFYQPYQQQSEKTILYFVNKLTRPSKPYVLIYFNDGVSSNGLTEFKSMLGLMPIQFFLHLERLYILKPSFRNKASGLLSFGTITRFINSKISSFETIDELCENLGFKKQDLVDFLPKSVKQIYFQKEEQEQIMNLKKMLSTADTQKSKKIDTKLQITDYTIGETGVPQLYEMLIFYFKHHEAGLKQEGLFRKSVSIVDEQEAMEQMKKKNYNFLEKVQNPHLVANLMKRFLAKIKTPIIPFELFNELIKRTDYPVPYMKEKMKYLQENHQVKFLTLVSMLKFFIEEVLPKKEYNKMTLQNVGICMAPCIMWAEQRSLKDLIFSSLSINILTAMITNFEAIFGDKRAQKKLFRSSYFNQKKKSIHESFSFLNDSVTEDKEKEQRITPNFKQQIMQTTYSYLEQLGEESQEETVVGQEGSTNQLKQTSKSILKIAIKKEEQEDHQKYVNELRPSKIKSQQFQLLRFSDCSDGSEKKQQIKNICLEQETEELQIREQNDNYLKPQKKRKGIFNTQMRDKSISSNKSNNKSHKSIH